MYTKKHTHTQINMNCRNAVTVLSDLFNRIFLETLLSEYSICHLLILWLSVQKMAIVNCTLTVGGLLSETTSKEVIFRTSHMFSRFHALCVLSLLRVTKLETNPISSPQKKLGQEQLKRSAPIEWFHCFQTLRWIRRVSEYGTDETRK